ncbi:MAG: adenylate kinase [Sediminibacterium sp.]|nr:adenylate kinase [Sediminibacterium sp.]
MNNYILFGPPGSGKGTQSDLMIARFKLIHLATGNMLRAEIQQKTELGLEAQAIINRGELVPDNMVNAMIEEKIKLNQQAAGFLFDGYPRTISQAKSLDTLLEKFHTSIQVVFSLIVPEADLIERLLHRGLTSGRTDDNETIIKARIIEYKEKTAAVGHHYSLQNKLIELDGTQSIDDVFAAIVKNI